MINKAIRGHQIKFYDENLPFNGRMHNMDLDVTVICKEMVINRVLIYDGSGLNICPL